VHFIYATKADSDLDRQRILFLAHLMDHVAAVADPNVTLRLFLTGTGLDGPIEYGKLPNHTFARRLRPADLLSALDGYARPPPSAKEHRAGTVCYVCGPPRMTDESVANLSEQPGMAPERVLCEKWW